MSTQNKTSIEIELKKLNSNFNTFNKIMSSFLVIATSESTFKNKNNKEIRTIVPVINSNDKNPSVAGWYKPKILKKYPKKSARKIQELLE